MATNLPSAAHRFSELLLAALPTEVQAYARQQVGVVDTLVIRMVPDPPADERLRDPLLVWTNGMAQLPVDRKAFKGEIPPVPWLRLVDDMRAEETRKLYTYNMCHAALAYLGARRGHILTVDCLTDPLVRVEVEGALDEISGALQAEYGFAPSEMASWNAGVLEQTDNPTLGDTVARHGADPRRKLKRTDRLVGPALLARKHGIAPLHLARAVAAGFLYNDPDDPGAVFAQERVALLGLSAAVQELCELADDEADLVEMITSAYGELI
jgi:mannitol-1-phosphate 5-dehydrogenase